MLKESEWLRTPANHFHNHQFIVSHTLKMNKLMPNKTLSLNSMKGICKPEYQRF